MYNEAEKISFMRSYSDSEKTHSLIRQIFEKFDPYERSYDLDISMFTAEQLQPIVSELTGLRQKSSDLTMNILKEYIKWRLRNGHKTSRGIFSVHIDSYEKIRDQMVSSPLHLQSKLDHVFDTPEKKTVDCIYRVYLWMAFSGLPDEESATVTDDEVDLHQLRIFHGNQVYELYKESIPDFYNACTSTEFVFDHQSYCVMRSRAPGNAIMRGFRSTEVKLKTIRPLIATKFKTYSHEKDSDGNWIKIKSGYKLSYQRVYLSGLFYRIYERERAGIPADFSEIVALEIKRTSEEGGGYTLSKNRTMTKIANTMAREYMADYEQWKNAFDV